MYFDNDIITRTQLVIDRLGISMTCSAIDLPVPAWRVTFRRDNKECAGRLWALSKEQNVICARAEYHPQTKIGPIVADLVWSDMRLAKIGYAYSLYSAACEDDLQWQSIEPMCGYEEACRKSLFDFMCSQARVIRRFFGAGGWRELTDILAVAESAHRRAPLAGAE